LAIPIVPIQTRDQGNLIYPLPPDYTTLSTEGQRQARINACRQWLIPRDRWFKLLFPNLDGEPSDSQELVVDSYRAEAMVASVRFFDEWYLYPDREADFDSMFYDEDPLPTPPFHYNFFRAVANEAAVVEIAPRGSAKSFKERKLSCLRLITRPNYKILYCTSTEKVATDNAQAVRLQCYTNQRIQDDWLPEYGERLKPNRGDAPTGIEEFSLSNGSTFATYSVNSRMRGKRPRRFVLDDPEYDPSASTSMAVIREYMKRLLLKIALPMVMRRECGIEWLATFVSKRHFAYQAMAVKEIMEEGRKVFRSEVSEFDYWYRILVRAAEEDPQTGKLISCWPHQWPADDVERKALGLSKKTLTLPEIAKRIGQANFNSEYMARPGDNDENFFQYSEEKHGYSITNLDPLFATNPRASQSTISWHSWDKGGNKTKTEMPLHQFLSQYAKLFITVDTSRTASTSSDYKCSTLMAITPDNHLFVLDTWWARCQPGRLIDETFRMADLWKCQRIAPEEIEDGINLSRDMRTRVATRAQEYLGITFIPVVKGFNPGRTDKTTKISSLAYRFEHGLIKLPVSAKGSPKWRPLFEQIEGFNPDAEDGGLQNDDQLDTVSMSQFIITGRLARGPVDKPEPESALELLLTGETMDDNGVPLAYHLDIGKMTANDVYKVMEKIKTSSKDASKNKI